MSRYRVMVEAWLDADNPDEARGHVFDDLLVGDGINWVLSAVTDSKTMQRWHDEKVRARAQRAKEAVECHSDQ